MTRFSKTLYVLCAVLVAALPGCGLLGGNESESTSKSDSPVTADDNGSGALGEALKDAKKAANIPGLGGLAEAVSGLEKAAEDQGKTYGPVIHWKELASFLPEEIDGLAADGELDAKTTKMAGFEVSTAKRRYKSAEKTKVEIELLDTTVAPVLRTPFAVAHMINEDSTKGFKKGTKIEGHQAMVEWQKKRKRSHASVLVGGRFLLNVTVRGKDEPNAAESIAKSLDLKKLNGMVGTLKESAE